MTSEELKAKYKDKCPPPGTWMRHKETGDMGQVVEEDGDWWIRPNIPGSPVRYPATQAMRWSVEQQPRKLPPGSYARIAYDANRALCEIHPELKKPVDWLSLGAHEKARWIEARVQFKNVLQARLYAAIIKTLEEYSE